LFRSFEPFPYFPHFFSIFQSARAGFHQALAALGARLVKINPEHQVYALAYMAGLTQSRFKLLPVAVFSVVLLAKDLGKHRLQQEM